MLYNAKRYGEKVQVDQTNELSEASDEELHAALRQKIRAMAAEGFDFKSILGEAGVAH